MSWQKPRVLCVDDEPNVLSGLKLSLRRHFDVETATSGAAGLATLKNEGPFAVVLSDLQMPAMAGAGFLARVREIAPETVRMLLTGLNDLNAAMEAVNEGQIFRFLTKPCPPKQLLSAFQAAAEQHRLITAERVLLEETLSGSIRTLTEILSLANPAAFGRANRVKRYVQKLCEAMELPLSWELEVAAMLSQLGCVILPPETAEKFYYGRELSTEEQGMVNRLPEFTEQLLRNIPRLETVRDILLHQNRPFSCPDSDEDRPAEEGIPFGSRLLKIALDYDVLEAQEVPEEQRLKELGIRAGSYDPKGLDALAKVFNEITLKGRIEEIRLKKLEPGMIFADDVKTKKGGLLIARGNEATAGLIARFKNFRAGTIQQPIRVLVPAEETD